MGAIYLR